MPEAPSGFSFEADLRALREDRGLAVADIERATRVPADVVRRFEEGALMHDPDFSAVYLRAFVKAYAEALDLSTSQTNAAFDAARQGTYRGALRESLPDEADEAKETATKTTVGAQTTAKSSAQPPSSSTKAATSKLEQAPEKKPASATSRSTGSAPAVEALANKSREDKPAPSAPPPRRSSPPSSLSSSNQSWGLIAGIAVMSVVALSVVFWLIFRQPGPDLEPVASAPVADTTAAPDTTDAPARPAIPPAPQIGDTIRVTVIAADGPLQNFRVEAAPDVRRPYWLEQGSEQTFVSTEEVIVWGNETASGYRIDSEAQLRMAGLTWAPANGAVQRLTRARAQAVVDSLHRAQYGS